MRVVIFVSKFCRVAESKRKRLSYYDDSHGHTEETFDRLFGQLDDND